MELVKKQIHMNQFKGNVATQITLDDDFIVPDSMEDMAQVLLSTGEIQMDAVKNQGEKVTVKGKLDFWVLYRREGGGLLTLGGSIPFDEVINAPGLEEKDFVGLGWTLEDLSAEMINSRKLGVQAIVSFEVRIETLRDVEAAVDVAQSYGGYGKNVDLLEPAETLPQVLKKGVSVAAIAVRRKDTYRLKEELTLTGGKPNIDRLLWRELKLRDMSVKPLDGQIHLAGELSIFAIYQAEGEGSPVQWIEELLPFSGELTLEQAKEEMIPMVSVRLAHKELEPKPDYDGEMRQLDVDAVLELDIKLYEEQEIELLDDLYSVSKEMDVTRTPACFDRLLAKNACKCRVSEKLELSGAEHILQICRSDGTVKVDEVELLEDGVKIDGVLEVSLLYLTNDDEAPIQAALRQVPFSYSADVRNITPKSIYQLNPGLEQLSAVMLGGDKVELKAVLSLDLLVLAPECQDVIVGASQRELDLEKLQDMPGIVGYVVQTGDTLWKIAKEFHTTMESVMEVNELTGETLEAGQRLLVMKEVVDE